MPPTPSPPDLSAPTRAGRRRRRRRTLVAAVLAAVVLLVAGLGAVSLLTPTSTRPTSAGTQEPPAGRTGHSTDGAVRYTTAAAGERAVAWTDGQGVLSATEPATTAGTVRVVVDPAAGRQRVDGYGAALTDSSAALLAGLKKSSPQRYGETLRELFSPTGTHRLTRLRVPIGSSDFTAARMHWTDADRQGPPQDRLRYFGLHRDELARTVPVLKDALAVNPRLHLEAAPWSAPAWMKTNRSLAGTHDGRVGRLEPAMRSTWAEYLVRWIHAYRAHGITIDALSPQNEPYHAPGDYPGMVYTPAELSDFLARDLAPALRHAGLGSVLLVGHDHNWEQSRQAARLGGSAARPLLAGMGWHCYGPAGPGAATEVSRRSTGVPQYVSECSSDVHGGPQVRYGTAEMVVRAQAAGARSFLFWNLALDPSGGPHLGGCRGCRPLVEVDGARARPTAVLRQLAQVSHFVPEGSVVTAASTSSPALPVVSFRREDGRSVVVAHNPTDRPVPVRVEWRGRGYLSTTLAARSTWTAVVDAPRTR